MKRIVISFRLRPYAFSSPLHSTTWATDTRLGGNLAWVLLVVMAPSHYVKSREAEYSRWYLIDGRPHLPKINADASLSRFDGDDVLRSRLFSGGAMSVIDVAVCTVLPALRTAMAYNATDIGQGASLASLSSVEDPPPLGGYTFTYYETKTSFIKGGSFFSNNELFFYIN